MYSLGVLDTSTQRAALSCRARDSKAQAPEPLFRMQQDVDRMLDTARTCFVGLSQAAESGGKPRGVRSSVVRVSASFCPMPAAWRPISPGACPCRP